MKFLLSLTCRLVAMWTSRTEAVVALMIQSNCGEQLDKRVEAIDLLFIQK